MADALDEARKSADLLLLSYVVMPDHYHIITDGKREPSDTLRFLNGISAKRILEYKYSVWEHHADTFLVTSESMLMEAC